jgi:hypothetical protein
VPSHTFYLEQILQSAPAIHRTAPPQGGGGHPGKFALTLDGGIVVLGKPGDDAQHDLMTRCEAAAWRVACLLSWTDLMPATALRNTAGHLTPSASVQILWPNAHAKDLAAFDPEDLWRAALFDRLIDHADRSASNWLAVEDTENVWHIKLIDNGYAFGTGGGTLNSEIVRHVQGLGQPIPGALRITMANFCSQIPDLYLTALLPADQVTRLTERAADLANIGTL